MTAYQIEKFLANQGIFYCEQRQKYRMESLTQNKWKSPEHMFRLLRDKFGIKQALKLMLNITETRPYSTLSKFGI